MLGLDQKGERKGEKKSAQKGPACLRKYRTSRGGACVWHLVTMTRPPSPAKATYATAGQVEKARALLGRCVRSDNVIKRICRGKAAEARRTAGLGSPESGDNLV